MILSDSVTTTTHEHAAHPALQHHFENMEQQREAGTLGMWVFLVTEIMFFGGMFLAYTLYRYKYPDAFAAASNHLDIKLGAVNTVVLIVSSFTMAMAVFSTQIGRRRSTIIYLVVTLVLGATFLGIKAVEYKAKYDDHLIPGQFDSGPSVQSRGGATRRHGSAQAASARRHLSPACRNVLLDLFHHDRHARACT